MGGFNFNREVFEKGPEAKNSNSDMLIYTTWGEDPRVAKLDVLILLKTSGFRRNPEF